MPAYRTLGDIRAELAARLGYAASGASAGVSQPILNSFLKGAQSFLYWNVDWKVMRRRVDKSIGVGQIYIDYPVELNAERVSEIWTNINPTGSASWTPVKQGIEPAWYNSVALQNYPQRYEYYSQIEIWPEPNAVYQLRFFGTMPLARFTEDGDRASLDDDMILLFALSNAKSHYKHADAAVYNTQTAELLSQMRGKSLRKVYNKDDSSEPPEPKPVVV